MCVQTNHSMIVDYNGTTSDPTTTMCLQLTTTIHHYRLVVVRDKVASTRTINPNLSVVKNYHSACSSSCSTDNLSHTGTCIYRNVYVCVYMISPPPLQPSIHHYSILQFIMLAYLYYNMSMIYMLAFMNCFTHSQTRRPSNHNRIELNELNRIKSFFFVWLINLIYCNNYQIIIIIINED